MEVEHLPRLLSLLNALSITPPKLTLTRGTSKISFMKMIKWVKKRDPLAYKWLLESYGCLSDTCLARSLAAFILHITRRDGSLFSLNEPLRAGDLHEYLRGLLEDEWIIEYGLRGPRPL